MHHPTFTGSSINIPSPESDLVGRGVAQWRKARPDLDSSGKEVIGRVIRLEGVLLDQVEKALQPFNLSYFEYAVLATLRVANSKNGLRPNELMARLICSSGGLSNLLKRLEARGLVQRSSTPADGRMVLVKLTKKGTKLADQAMPEHAKVELKLVSMLSQAERNVLARLLSRMMVCNAPELM